MFLRSGGIVYVKDIDRHIYEGTVLGISMGTESAFVRWENDSGMVSGSVSFRELERTEREVLKNAALLF